MYRPPIKIQAKYLATAVLFIFLLLLPFKNLINFFLINIGRNLNTPQKKYFFEIKRLQKQNIELLLENRELAYLKKENVQLKEILKFKEERKLSLIGAEVILFDPSIWRRIITINAGKISGIKKGCFAVNEEGWVIGKIIEVKGDYSRLMLISDPDFILTVFVGDSAFGLLKGGIDRVKILYLEENAEINLKDIVWIKAWSSNLPLYIGEVEKRARDKNSFFWDVDVKLFSKNSPLKNIFVIK